MAELGPKISFFRLYQARFILVFKIYFLQRARTSAIAKFKEQFKKLNIAIAIFFLIFTFWGNQYYFCILKSHVKREREKEREGERKIEEEREREVKRER